MAELHRRGRGEHESGAFLLGTRDEDCGVVSRWIYYDDLEPSCLDSGVVIFEGAGYGELWRTCRETGLSVLADVHTHMGRAIQSYLDRDNPMVAVAGHIAIIVPWLAARVVPMTKLGIYEYLGDHEWVDHSGRMAEMFFHIGSRR